MKLFMLILMTTQMVVDVEYKSNEEGQDSEKSVDYPSDDYYTEWNKFQNLKHFAKSLQREVEHHHR